MCYIRRDVGVWCSITNTLLLTRRTIKQAAFRRDDPHSLEELRVGERQLNHLPHNNSSIVLAFITV